MLEWLLKSRKSAPTPSESEVGPGPGAPADEAASLVHAGLNFHRAGRLAEAQASYQRALQVEPENVDATHFLGVAAYQTGRLDEADELLSRALSRNANNAPAHNNLGNVRVRQGRLDEAIASFNKAISLQADYLDPLLNLASVWANRGEFDKAIACYERALSWAPNSPVLYAGLADVCVRQGRLDEAAGYCRKALTLDPGALHAHFLLGNVHQQQGDREQAAACYRQAIALKEDFAEAHCNLGHVLRASARAVEALACYEKALVIDPNNLDARSGLATAFLDLGELDRAVSAYRQAAALAPEVPEVHSNLGNALRQIGRLEEAVASCRQALALNPVFPAALCNLGIALAGQDKLAEASACYLKALEIEPSSATVHYNLGDVLARMGRHVDGLEHFRRALSLNQDYHEARWAIAMSQLPAVCDIDEQPASHREAFSRELRALEHWFDAHAETAGHRAVGTRQPFYLAYQEENHRALLERHGNLCARLMARWYQEQGLTPPGKRRAGKVVRVGIVSGHLRGGSIWEAVIEGWFRNFDASKFALHVYALGTARDEHTALAQSRAAQFEQGAGGLRQWVDAIEKAELDVLIYPEIGIDPLTLRLASLRLAPVQVTTWGHPQTTGLPTIDYFLSAQGMEPENAQEHYTERLVALPNLGCCYYRSADLGSTPPQLAGLGLDQEAPILVCPGTPFKYAPEHDGVYVKIARELGRCRFVFFTFQSGELSEKLRRRLEAAFAREGLRFAEFGTFLPWLKLPAFRGLLRQADVYLDTVGFSGFNTAMLAAECAVPVVTREGGFLRGRFAAGILRRMELPELIAHSADDYVALAARLCRDAEYRRGVRRRIEAGRDLLFEDVAPIRAMEDFLASVVRQ